MATGEEGLVRGREQGAADGGRWPWSPASALLAAAMLASGTLLVVWGSRLTFILDDWVFILYKRGFNVDTFLTPDNEHLVAGPVAVWQLLLNTFGMSSMVPFRIVSTAMFLLGAWFLFVWIKRRLGEWPALIATIPILFLGAAYDDFLWFSSITFLGAMACGLGMLVALDRRDRLGDLFACAWLVGSMLFSSLWLAFAAGALVDIVLRRGDRDWRRRAFVLAVPLILYAIWWLGWGHDDKSAITLHNIAATPIFVLDSFAAALAALFGLATPAEGMASPSGLDWGRPLAIALGGLGAWRLYRLERVPRSLWVVLAIVVAFWALGGFAVKPGRVPWASRYQYPGAALMLLVAADLLRGVKLDRRALIAAVLVVGAAVLSNVLYLHEAYTSYRSTTQLERADLGALEIARNTVEPNFFLDEENADTGVVHVDAGSYLSARDAYGSPGYTPEEISRAPEVARFAADKVLVSALRFGLAEVPPTSLPKGEPRTAQPNSKGLVVVPADACIAAPPDSGSLFSLPPDGVTVAAGSKAVSNIKMRRFASENFSVDFGEGAEPGQAVEIRIPPDASTVPWKMQLEGGASTVCGLQPEGA